jgi:phytanoyl-CoA hydroxylase
VVTLERTVLEEFKEQGLVVLEGLLDPVEDLQPVIDEYTELLDRLANQWFEEGKIPSAYNDLPFRQRLVEVARDTKGEYWPSMTISLQLADVREDSPMHHGPAVFGLLTNRKLLDAIETFVGPEIYVNPVHHARIKGPERNLPQEKRISMVGETIWHQDQGVVHEEASTADQITVWVPITEATEENGCLVVVPGSHKGGLGLHCFGPSPKARGIPEEVVGSYRKALPMNPGDVLVMNKLTMHSSLPNMSDDIRWSFDLRYTPIGQPTGHPWFPGFVARSQAHPETELRDAAAWDQLWLDTRTRLARVPTPDLLTHWNPLHPGCA